MKFKIFTDGGSRNNPGPAGIGFAVYEEHKNSPYFTYGKRIGIATNNVAEYSALIEGLIYCQSQKAIEVDCFLDSMLIVNQLNGKFKVKEPSLLSYVLKIKE